MQTPNRTRSGRLRGAWECLMGRSLTPRQIEAEWVEYKLMFDEILGRLSTQLARQAKYERKRVKAMLSDLDVPGPAHEPQTPANRKAELRSKAAAMRGLSAPHMNGRARQVDAFSIPEEAP